MKDKKYPSGEYRLLEKIQKTLGTAAAPDGKYPLTLGDDAAVRLGREGERLVLTADVAVEGVHFTTGTMTFEEIGFRVMAANVSDCAAMAALPDAALVLLVFPKNAENLKGEITGIYRGFRKACRKWKFRVVGGDLSCGRVWTIGITILGTAPGRVLRRKGIRAGDVLWGSGFPGRSAAGLAAIKKWGRNRAERRYPRLVCSHIAPSPPLELGIALGRCRKTHAMMDLSDGISKDARTLCFENRLGLQLSFDDIKVPEDMLALGRELKISWQEWALHGGEDYTLLFAASRSFGAGDVPEKFRSGLVRLGMFTDEHKELVLREVGRIKKIPAKGWDHTGR